MVSALTLDAFVHHEDEIEGQRQRERERERERKGGGREREKEECIYVRAYMYILFLPA